jgi:shikimate dehydrogenase
MEVPYAEVIGDPVAHSKSPLIHNFWLAALGIRAEYRATRVAAAELGDYVTARRRDPLWRGCNVTMPLKLPVLDALDDLDPAARRIGAVNTVVPHEGRLVGHNTDGLGMKRALPIDPRGRDVVLIGAGGAARAALEELAQARPRTLTILNRDEGKAARLLQEFGLEGIARGLGAPLPTADLLINASALGMAGFPPLELDLSPLPVAAVVMDMVYAPLETDLLRQARARGLKVVAGLAMLVWQAASAFELFFHASPDDPQSRALREVLTR